MSDQVILAIFGTVSAGLGWLGKFAKEYWDKRQTDKGHNNYIKRLKAIADVYNSMDRLQSSERIDRVFLLEISNGGHSPKPGSRLFAKSIKLCLAERSYSKEELINRYERVPLDHHYIQLAIKARQDGVYKFKVSEEVDCMLKRLYMSEEVEYSEVYHIHTDVDEEKMFIMSVATYDESERFEGEVFRAFLSTEIMVIRSNFQQYR